MAEALYPEPLTWGNVMDFEDLMDDQTEEASNFVEATIGDGSCQQNQSSQSSTQPGTPDLSGEGGHPGSQTHQPAHHQGQGGGPQERQAPGRRRGRVHQGQHHDQAPEQRGGRGHQGQHHHQAPGQKGWRGHQGQHHHQAPGQRGWRGHQGQHHHQAPGQRGNNNQTPYNPGCPSQPFQRQVEANLRSQVEELNALLREQRDMKNKLTLQLDLSTKKTIELQELARVEKTTREELEGVNAAAAENNQKLQQLLTLLQTQLQEEKQRADHLSRERDQLRCAVFTARHVTDLERIQHLEAENQALRQEVEDAQGEILRREVVDAEQLETLRVQLQEKSSSCLELVSKLKEEEEVSQALLQEVEELRKEKQQEENEEPAPQMENIEEVPPTPDQDSSITIQDNAAVNNGRLTKDFFFFQRNNLTFLEHPACSPDLNHSENIMEWNEEEVYKNGRQFQTVDAKHEASSPLRAMFPLTSWKHVHESRQN